LRLAPALLLVLLIAGQAAASSAHWSALIANVLAVESDRPENQPTPAPEVKPGTPIMDLDTGEIYPALAPPDPTPPLPAPPASTTKTGSTATRPATSTASPCASGNCPTYTWGVHTYTLPRRRR